jgi:hypothetical protein
VPEISRFFGIVVWMVYRDHNPPHFHAAYGEQEVSVTILDGGIDGQMSKRALRLVQEWRKLHSDELMDNWLRARDRRPLEPIPPLE